MLNENQAVFFALSSLLHLFAFWQQLKQKIPREQNIAVTKVYVIANYYIFPVV